MADPDVHDYLDFRAFLRDWFEARRAREPSFSRRGFSRLLGRTSPGLFAEVVDGRRRILPETARAFALALRLDRASADFFDALVGFGQATDEGARRVAWERILASRRFRLRRRAQHRSWSYVTCWWIPVVRELARRPDFDPDPRRVARQVRPPITEDQARHALEVLGELGPGPGAVALPAEVEPLAEDARHRGLVALAGAALDHVPLDERHLLGLALTVRESDLDLLAAELDALHLRLLERSAAPGEPRTRVVHVQVAVFPVTDRTPDRAP